MSHTYSCGDYGALVSYLYNECAPDERLVISAHVAVCSACAEELTSLDATRGQLAMWSPPEAKLGFKVVPEAQPARVLRPARWWRQPMPGWAQAAAAAVIFATGLTLGALRGVVPAPNATSSQASRATALTSAANRAVTQSDLAALEQRIRAEMAQASAPSGIAPAAMTPASAGEAQILARVRAMIQESEQRQQRELALRTAEVVRDFDTQRRVDLTRIERTLGQMDGTTGAEVEQQRQMLNYLVQRVSQPAQ